jgi:hypothetical protein
MAIREKIFLQNGKIMLYRRGDEGSGYQPENWYVKIKFPRKPAERESLGTSDIEEAKELANDRFQEIKYRFKKGLSVKQSSFKSVASQYCTSSEHMAPLEPFSKRHFSARTFSSLAC